MGGLAGLTDMFRAQATEKQRNALIVLEAQWEVQDLATHGLTGKDVDGLLTPPFDLVEVVVTHLHTNDRVIASYRLTGRGRHVARMLMEDEERPCSTDRQVSQATPTDDGPTPDAPPLSPLKPAKAIVTIGEWSEKFRTFKAAIYGAWQHLDSVRPGFMEAWADSPHGRSRNRAHVSKSKEDVSLTMSRPLRCASGTWYVPSNYNIANLQRFLRHSCEANGMKFGVDVCIYQPTNTTQRE